jgi:cytochrome P450
MGVELMTTVESTNYNIFDPAIRENPYGMYREIQQQGAVMRNPELGIWMVSTYQEALEALKRPDILSSASIGLDPIRRWLRAPTMLFSDPPEHERLRGVVAKAFSPAAIKALEYRVRDVSRELFDTISGNEAIDVVAQLAYPLPVIMIAELLGIPPGDRKDFKRWSDAVVAFSGLGDPAAMEHLSEPVEELLSYLTNQLVERNVRPRNDLITQVAQAKAKGVLSEEEALASCVLLLVAGNETTTNLLSNTFLAFTLNPGEFTALRSDRSLLSNAVEEILRFDPPVQAIPRFASGDVTLGGTTIPDESMVLILNAAANRDPATFVDPDNFRVARPNAGRHLGFGFGTHHCIGATLARIEGRVVLDMMVDQFTGFELVDDCLEYGPNFFLRGLSRLRLDVSRSRLGGSKKSTYRSEGGVA